MSQSFNNYGNQIGIVTNSLAEYAELIGTTTTGKSFESILNCQAGLNMDIEAAILQNTADNIRRGIFRVMVMGTFNNGKSTFLNSIIGVKILPTRVLACTAIITIIVYGKNKDVVKVYYRDRTEPEEMSIADFNANFKLASEDILKIDQEGYLDKFSNIEYAVIESDYPLCNNGIQIVDSPGLEERRSATDVTTNFIPNSNAIIFTLNATKLFSEKERDYIRDNFVDRQLNNVFFLVNQIDRVNNDEVDDVKTHVRDTLHSVFKDKNGRFDNELYNQRVFFTNAFGAMEARISNNMKAYKESGVADFEKAMEHFLMTDSKFLATFDSALTNMTNIYPKVLEKMEQDIETLQRPLDELLMAQNESDKILDKEEKKKKDLKAKFITTANTVFLKLSHSLRNYVETMKRTWDVDIENIEIKGFGVWSAAKSIFVSEEKKKDLYKPVAEAVEVYIKGKMEIWKAQAGIEIKPDIDLLSQDVDDFSHDFDVQVTKAVDLFMGKSGQEFNKEKNKFNVFQTLAGVLIGDASLTTMGALGLYSWDKFVVRVVYNVLITMGVLLFFGNIAGLILIIIESLQIWRAGRRLQMQILQRIKDDLFTQLTKAVQESDEKLKKEIDAEFDKQFQPIEKTVTTIISQIKNSQAEIINGIQSRQNIVENEQNRHEIIKNRIVVLIGQVYEIVHSRKMGSSVLQEELETN